MIFDEKHAIPNIPNCGLDLQCKNIPKRASVTACRFLHEYIGVGWLGKSILYRYVTFHEGVFGDRSAEKLQCQKYASGGISARALGMSQFSTFIPAGLHIL